MLTCICCNMQALVLALLCERARGGQSFWAPYVCMLPTQVIQEFLHAYNLCLSVRDLSVSVCWSKGSRGDT